MVKCVSCVSLLSQDFTLLKILSLFLFSVPHRRFYFLSLFLHSLSRSTSVQSVLFSVSRPNSRRKDVFFYALRTSGKILLSKHLSIIRALLTFELSSPSGRIKIVYTKTFIHSFVFLLQSLCR